MNNTYFKYLNQVFANVKTTDKVIVRLDSYIPWFVNILQEYSSQRELDILTLFDDISLINASNYTICSYYVYFLNNKTNDFSKENINSFLIERKKVYDILNLKKYIRSGNWMIAYIPPSQNGPLDEWMSLEQMNYLTMYRKCFPLYAKLRKSHTITIVRQDMKLFFSYSQNDVFTCFGEHNIPDGEIGVIPAEKTVTGTISFEKVNFHGFVFNNLLLNFQNGKCTSYSCKEKKEFEKILNFDSRSMYIGEFAFGVNPYIKKASDLSLIDEKQLGTFHLALGGAENTSTNSKASFIHMDMISQPTCLCEVYADNELIFKGNQFVGATLKSVNRRR